MDILEEFKKKRVPYPVGHQLDAITKACAKVYGEKVIRVVVPYRNFNCRGPANKIAEDVLMLMPFKGTDVLGADKTTTLFYGETKVGRGSYLPFQADCDTFYVDSVQELEVSTIQLVKAPNWREYL